MVGIALKEARRNCGLTQEGLGKRYFLSGSMINEVEHSRKRLPKELRPKVAQDFDDGALYMQIAREATGGPMTSPYLDNVDNHRLVAVLKFQEEMLESLDQVQYILPILLRAQGPQQLKPGEFEVLEGAMLEMIESTTAATNSLDRLAKTYGISLAKLWDNHETDLVMKGYKKEKDRF
jgi:transcriptional regulator with XRE-family HTH domain